MDSRQFAYKIDRSNMDYDIIKYPFPIKSSTEVLALEQIDEQQILIDPKGRLNQNDRWTYNSCF